MNVEETAKQALWLFRQGMDTVAIARSLQIGEARASKLLWYARCKERNLPAEYLYGGVRKRIAE
jgi:hypothetical protein